ncbi:MAG TPA: hypothetical protein VFN30_13500 [Chitinophagaceae bacterium]|nr:hypothetical protein [Chitinophagaceae bacterium]
MPQSERPTLSKFKVEGELYDANIRLQLKKYFSETSTKYSQLLNSELKSEEINSDFLVVDGVKKSVVLFENGIFEQFGNADEEVLVFVKNTVFYFKLFNFLKSKDFCDYFNSANNQIIVYSSAKGVYKINYETIPEIPKDRDIEKDIAEFIKNASPIELRPYFKSSIFSFTDGKGFIKLNHLINNSSEIIFSALRDHDLVLKQFDFENFRNSLYKEKGKYFANIREIINKIFSQAVGIPVSISAAVFATYKVSNDTLMLFLVMLSFIVYVIFYVKIQCVYRAEIKEIETDFNNDFNIIASKSGLQPDIINKENVKIKNKISSSLTILNWLIGIVIFLGLLVCIYIYYEIEKSETFCLLKLILKIF